MPSNPTDEYKRDIAQLVPEDSLKKRPVTPELIELVKRHLTESLDLATTLHEGNQKAAVEWLEKPSDLCFNCSPYECVVRGDGEAIIKWLRDRLGQNVPERV